MPQYEYRSDDGAVIYDMRSMNAHHPETMTRGGKVYYRVYGNCQLNTNPVESRYPVVSRGLMGQPAAADCDHVEVEVGNKYRRKVKMPVIESKEHEKALAGKHNLERDPHVD